MSVGWDGRKSGIYTHRADIVEEAGRVASGEGELDLANRLYAFEAVLREKAHLARDEEAK